MPAGLGTGVLQLHCAYRLPNRWYDVGVGASFALLALLYLLLLCVLERGRLSAASEAIQIQQIEAAAAAVSSPVAPFWSDPVSPDPRKSICTCTA